jgi:outer membrane protein TolC
MALAAVVSLSGALLPASEAIAQQSSGSSSSARSNGARQTPAKPPAARPATTPAPARQDASRPQQTPASAARPGAAPSPAAAAAAAAATATAVLAAQAARPAVTEPAGVDLQLLPFVRQIRAESKAVISKRNELELARTGVERASAAFQPQASFSAQNGRQLVKNTPEEDLVRQGLGIYDRKGQDYSAGVSQLLAATGAKLEAKASLSQFMTNITRNIRQNDSEDFKSFYGVTITQPLARDFGRDVTLARVRVAELEAQVARHAGGDTESSVVAESIFSYWDLLLAQERLKSAQEKVRMGEGLLREADALNRRGRLPEHEVWEVQNNLGRFNAGLSEARQGVQERVNKLRTMLMAAAKDAPAALRASDPLPEMDAAPIGFEQAYRRAIERREDYRMRKLMLEREGVQLDYAHNQKRPRVDLVASYGLNGLELAADKSLAYNRMNDFPTWSVGVQVSMPIGANRQAGADLQAAMLRRQEAMHQIKALEVEIANDIDTGIAMISSAAERVVLWRDVAAREQRQLELERTRFVAGRSDMREILLREERAINARLAVIEQRVAWAKADVLLSAAQGILLERFQ